MNVASYQSTLFIAIVICWVDIVSVDGTQSWSHAGIGTISANRGSWHLELSRAFVNALSPEEVYFNIRGTLLTRSTLLFDANANYLNDFIRAYIDAMIQCDHQDLDRVQHLLHDIQKQHSATCAEIIRDLIAETGYIFRARMFPNADLFLHQLQLHLERNSKERSKKLNLSLPVFTPANNHENERPPINNAEPNGIVLNFSNLTSTTTSTQATFNPGAGRPLSIGSGSQLAPITILKRPQTHQQTHSLSYDDVIATTTDVVSGVCSDTTPCNSSKIDNHLVSNGISQVHDDIVVPSEVACDNRDSSPMMATSDLSLQIHDNLTNSDYPEEEVSLDLTSDQNLDGIQLTGPSDDKSLTADDIQELSESQHLNISDESPLTVSSDVHSESDHDPGAYRDDEYRPISSAKKSRNNHKQSKKVIRLEQPNRSVKELEGHVADSASRGDDSVNEEMAPNISVSATTISVFPDSTRIETTSTALESRLYNHLCYLSLVLQDDRRFQSEDCNPNLLYSAIGDFLEDVIQRDIRLLLYHDFDSASLAMLSLLQHVENLQLSGQRLPSLSQIERELTCLRDLGRSSLDVHFSIIYRVLQKPLSKAIFQGVQQTKLTHIVSTKEYVGKILSLVAENSQMGKNYEKLHTQIVISFDGSLAILASLADEFPLEELPESEFHHRLFMAVGDLELHCTKRICDSLISLPGEFEGRFNIFLKNNLATLNQSGNKFDDHLVNAILQESRELLYLALKELKLRSLSLIAEYLGKIIVPSSSCFADEMSAGWVVTSIQNVLQDIVLAIVGRLHLVRAELLRKVKLRNSLPRKDRGPSRRKFDGNPFLGAFRDEFMQTQQYLKKLDAMIVARKTAFSNRLQETSDDENE